jgi:hypothetical protein
MFPAWHYKKIVRDMESVMALERKPTCRISRFALFAGLIVGCFIFCLPGRADDSTSSSETTKLSPDRYRVFLLKNITPQEGKQFLADANIMNVSQLNDSNSLLVTARPDVLVKASGIMALVDSREKYVVQALLPASDANKMPSPDTIAREIGKVSIGTFNNLPGGTGYKAILDTQDGMLFAVAPVAVMDKLVEYADKVKRASPLPDIEENLASVPQPAAESSSANPDKAFNELLESISKAEIKPKSSTAAKPKNPFKEESVTAKPKKHQPLQKNLPSRI